MTVPKRQISKAEHKRPGNNFLLWDQWSDKKQYNGSGLEEYYRIRERNLKWLTSLTFSLLNDNEKIKILKTDLWNEGKKDERYFIDAPGDKFGIDISSKICSLAKLKYDDKISMVQGTIESIPFHSGFFSLIWDISTIDHCRNPELALAEYYRVLQSGGILLLVVENLLCFSFPVTKIQSYLGLHVPFKGFLSSGIIKECQLAGFHVVDHFKTNVHLPKCIVYPLERKGVLEEINQGRNFFWNMCKKYSVIICRKP